MRTELPLRFKETAFGRLSDPKVFVAITTHRGAQAYRFLLDTGAGFSIAPKWLADEIGLEWARMAESRVLGVEQRGLTARLGVLPMQIGGVALGVRCMFVDRPTAFFVLGRADFLDRFVLTIDQPGGRIVLEAVDG